MHRDSVVTVRSEVNVVDRFNWDVGRLMVKIRFSELPSGLHVAAAADHDGTVVYLQPGLTPAQRRAALIRVRSSARMGQGPILPGPAMARAIAADKVRTNARIGASAARRHPVLFLPPAIALVVSAVVFALMTIQPLTFVTQGNVGASLPTLGLGGARLPATPSFAKSPAQQRHHRLLRAAAPGVTYPQRVQAALPPACANLQAPTSRLSWPTAPTRRNSPLAQRCLRRFQRWARTHRP